jgi:hypothetical protein
VIEVVGVRQDLVLIMMAIDFLFAFIKDDWDLALRAAEFFENGEVDRPLVFVGSAVSIVEGNCRLTRSLSSLTNSMSGATIVIHRAIEGFWERDSTGKVGSHNR